MSLSDDTGSLYSSTSHTSTEHSSTPDGTRRTGAASSSHSRPGSAPSRRLAQRGSDAISTHSEQGFHARQHSGDGTNELDNRLLGIGSVSGGTGMRRVPSPRSSLVLSLTAPSFDSDPVPDSRPHLPRQHRALSPSSSLPPRLVEELADGTQLASIQEGETLSNLTRSVSPPPGSGGGRGRSRRSSSPISRGREMSPELLARPVSPDGVSPVVSPVVSPSGSPRIRKRKTKLASKRKKLGSTSECVYMFVHVCSNQSHEL